MAAGDRAIRVRPTPQAPPKTGLVPSALHPTPPSLGLDSDTRWLNGLRVRDETCIGSIDVPGGYTWDGCATGGGTEPATGLGTDPRNDYEVWLPVTAVDGDECSSEGWSDDQDDINAQALRILLANVPRKIELELWSGRVANAAGMPNDWLANPATAVDVGDVPLAYALSELVQYLADTIPGRGMIHAMPRLVSLWFQMGNMIHREGNIIVENTADHIIVPGTGYTGAGPDDPDDLGGESGQPASVDTSTAYATGMVSLIEGRARAIGDLSSNLRRRDNTITWYGSEPYLAWFGSCAHGFVTVNHTNPCGNAS